MHNYFHFQIHSHLPGKNDALMLLEQETLPSATGEAQKPQALIRGICDSSCPRPSALQGLRALVPHIPIFPVGNESSWDQPPAALQSFSMTSLEQQNVTTKPSLEPFILPFPAKKQEVKLKSLPSQAPCLSFVPEQSKWQKTGNLLFKQCKEHFLLNENSSVLDGVLFLSKDFIETPQQSITVQKCSSLKGKGLGETRAVKEEH